MAYSPAKQFTSWSFSRWSDWRACPAKAKYKHLDKLKEPPNAAMERGTAIHKLAEDYTLKRIARLPKELALFKDAFKHVRNTKDPKMVEDQWTYRANWTHTTWNDWTGAWLRVKLDLGILEDNGRVLRIVDHKTGRMRDDKTEEYELQLDLYNTVGFVQHPTVEVVRSELWYLDAGVRYPEAPIEMKKPEAEKAKKRWLLRVKPMLADRTFKPTPGAACRWCHYRKDNGGPCKF